MIKIIRGWETLPQFSKDMYIERYFTEGETYQEWLNRMASFSDDDNMFHRIRAYISNRWFHPSTPISSNGNIPSRGLPISCYVNEVGDSKESIFDTFTENNWLGSYGGGIGTNWSNVRGIGEKVGISGHSSGIIPFLKVSDASTMAISQGSLRRASQAAYLHISHPEIEEFLDIRRPTGDSNRRCLNIHHGVVISDEFMKAVKYRDVFNLISPHTKQVIKTIDAFDLWKKLLVNRAETGEPYILFEDSVNRMSPDVYQLANKKVSTSNLCSEITLYTSENDTAVCCLGSLNLEYYDEYKDMLDTVVYDCERFLDNVLQSFIDQTANLKGFEKARQTAINERSLGLGVMGLHSYFQKKGIPFESAIAKSVNKSIFRNIDEAVHVANRKAALEFGECPLAKSVGITKRNTHVTSIAPTASISILCGATSQGVEPRLSNAYIHKTNIGTYEIKNKYLEKLLESKDKNTPDIWKSITQNGGSVQHLDFLSDIEKDIFKTAIEINQHHLIDIACDRTPYIDQAQSINIFIEADEHVRNLHNLHMRAWKGGLKSLYYCRSTTITRASATKRDRQIIDVEYCPSCQ